QDHAAARDVVERREFLGDDARVAEREQDDACADPDARGDRRKGRQREDDVENRVAVGDVVAGPDRVVAELLYARRRLPEDAGVWRASDELAAALDAEGDPAHRALRHARS